MRTTINLQEAIFSRAGEAPVSVCLPHTWNHSDGQDGGNDYYRGKGTYQIKLPDPTAGMEQYIQFEGANHMAEVFCNGKRAGIHKGGFSTFRFALTEYMKASGNMLKVIVDNEAPDVYPQQADFTFFGGLYRDVCFLEVEASHLDLLRHGSQGVFITPECSGHTRINAFPVKAGGYTLKVKICEADSGRPVAEKELIIADHAAEQVSLTCTVDHPHLWDGRQDPFLYRAAVSLEREGVTVDIVEITYGYRTFQVDAETGFSLNGRRYPLHGVSRHQDRQDKGWAISEADQAEDMELIREIGANTIRLAHYQHSQFFYNLCDQSGMVVWAEIPFISAFMDTADAKENARSQLKELILQNYHHPSICFFGISNEITITGESEALYESLCELHELARQLDPSRYTVMAHLRTVEPGSRGTAVTDLQGYNIYYGWYKGEVTQNGEILDEIHRCMPDLPVALSEYGADALTSWHSSEPVNHDYTEEYQAYYHEEMLKTFVSRDWLWATYVWNMYDFAADARDEGGQAGRNLKGLVTYDRKIRKDAFYIYQAFWSETPMVHLCGRRFVNRAGGERDIKVYTNCSEVTLLVNGTAAGTIAPKQHACVFEDVELMQGDNEIIAVTESGIRDSMMLCGVSEPDPAYVMPEDTLTAGNWFDEETGETLTLEFPEGRYSIRDTIGALLKHEQAAAVFMSFQKMAGGNSLQTAGTGDSKQQRTAMAQMMKSIQDMSLQSIIKRGASQLKPADIVKINQQLNQIRRKN